MLTFLLILPLLFFFLRSPLFFSSLLIKCLVTKQRVAECSRLQSAAPAVGRLLISVHDDLFLGVPGSAGLPMYLPA